ncbi:fimbria/pilus outer membrane usher protein [Aeromonas salmonicida]
MKYIKMIYKFSSFKVLSNVLIYYIVLCTHSWAKEYFDPASLQISDSQSIVDLELFNKGSQLPGTYRVDVYINRELFEVRDITFVTSKDGTSLKPKLTLLDLKAMGVKHDRLVNTSQVRDNELIDIKALIPDASTNFDFNALRLNVSIPQIAMEQRSRDNVSPESWDQGLPALMISYGVTGASQSVHNGETNSDAFVRLNTGINTGAWRLRNNATYSNTGDGWAYQDTYLQRDIHTLQNQLVIGDTHSGGYVFDSIPFRGIQLYSDEAMLYHNQIGYAPIVRGIATTDAQVTIRQNGYIIYQTNVAPGAFAIEDLHPSASGGNLDVTISESDGTERKFVQSFSTAPIMLRAGGMRYALTGGEYRSFKNSAATPTFIELSAIYGLNDAVTVYGGTQLSSNYRSLLFGAGLGLNSFGAISLDITHANTRLQDETRHSGQSFGAQYAKNLFHSGTTFTLAGHRYSSEEFYDFREANEIKPNPYDMQNQFNKRSKLSLQVSQTLGDFGTLFLTGSQQDRWNLGGYERSFMAGYNGSYNSLSYGVNFSDTQHPGSERDQRISISLNVPFDWWSSHASARYQISTDNMGRTYHETGINGTALAGRNLSYSASQRYGNRGEGVGGRASVDYKSAYGDINGAYSYSDESNTLSYGIAGALIAHPYGITLSQPVGDTAILVRAPGAAGAELQNQSGIATDWRGYAVVPSANAYRKNRVSLNTATLGDGVDVDGASQMVVPTRGALVLANFETKLGARALFSLYVNENPVPFGATATLEQASQHHSAITGIAGQNGEVYLSGLPPAGRLRLNWGPGRDEQCLADFRLPALSADDAGIIQMLRAKCFPSPNEIAN